MNTEQKTQISTDVHVKTWRRSKMERKIKKYAHYVREIEEIPKGEIHRNLLPCGREINRN